MFRALYRKWRPRTFDEISGQDHITKILRMQCNENRVSHAYLFCGTRGTGKTSTAKILAKAVNCEHPINGNPCNQCFSCMNIDSGNATDVLEIDAASNNGVDDIRGLRDEVVYPPSMLKKRVYIIDEVHMLSAGAFNALLKTLEEPPEYIVFILATTELNKLPATIISRCIRFDFTRLREDVIADRLRYVAEQEHIRLGDGAVELLARLADGAMRDGLSILEACTTGLGSENVITADAIRERIGIASADQLSDFYKAIVEKKIPDALSIIEDVHNSSKDLSIFWEDASSLARDMLILLQLKGDIRGYAGSFRFKNEAMQLLKAYPDLLTAEVLLYYCATIDDAQARITRYATNKKTMIEFATVRLCDISLSDRIDSLAARISRLEKQPIRVLETPIEPQPQISSEKIDTPVEQNEAPQNNGMVPFDQIAELVEEMMGHPELMPYIRKIKAYTKDQSFIVFADPFTNQMLQLSLNAKAFSDAVQMVTGKAYTIVFKSNEKEQSSSSPIDEL